MSEVKELIGQLNNTFIEFKKVNERALEEEKKNNGEARQETKNMIDELNGRMDAIQKQIDETKTAQNRGYQTGGSDETDEQREMKAEGFLKFLREGKAGLSQAEKKALVEDETGEIIVPEDMDKRIYGELPQLVVMRQLCGSRQTSSDRIKRVSLNETEMDWGKLETSTTKTLEDYESTLVPQDAYLYVENLYGLTKLGEDELQDSYINLQAHLSTSFARKRGEVEARGFLRGLGHANFQPEGVLTNAEVKKVDTKTALTVTFDDFIQLLYSVPAQYRTRGVFLIPSYLEMLARTIKDQTGNYIWQPSVAIDKPNTLFGKPVYVQDDFDALEAGKDVAVFGDFKEGYQILDHTGLTITRLNEKYIEQDLIGFRAKARVGGGVIQPKALAKLNVKA